MSPFHPHCDQVLFISYIFCNISWHILIPLFICLVLVSPGQDEKDWDFEVLTLVHNDNGYNDVELVHVHKNLLGEPECIIDQQVLSILH